MKKMKYLLTLICLAAVLTSCKESNENDTPSDIQTTRTVMVYMAGENNLTVTNGVRFLRNDLNEMIEGSKLLGKDQRLLIFVDSLNTSSSSKKGTPFIIEVHDGKTTVLHQYDSNFYSCDPAKFKEVLQFMVKEAPAKSYGLVLWGHASGWTVINDSIVGTRETRAYGEDDGKNSGVNSIKWMNITQMARALKELPKLEFIFADCCNMMCAEVGYELRNVTNYLIGSPAEIPGDGAPYDEIIPYLYKSGSQLYKNIIDTYYDYYIEDFEGDYFLDGYSVPLSVIETKYMEQLAQATHDVLDKFTDGYPSYPQSPDMSGIVFYLYYDVPVLYDMRAFIKLNTSEADFLQWDKVYQQAVPYYRMSLRWMTIYEALEYSMYSFIQDSSINGCVSTFIPRNNRLYYNGTFHYNKTFNNFGWNRVLDWSRYGWTPNSTYSN